jgi:hypothetical protein
MIVANEQNAVAFRGDVYGPGAAPGYGAAIAAGQSRRLRYGAVRQNEANARTGSLE